MRTRVLTGLRFLAAAAIVVSAILNFWQFNHRLSNLVPRDKEYVVALEWRLRGVRDALMRVRYDRGNVGYMTAGVLRGNRRTDAENLRWVVARYALIPWNLVQDSLEPPYVLADFSDGAPESDLPQGFVKVFDSRDGFMLLRKTSQP